MPMNSGYNPGVPIGQPYGVSGPATLPGSGTSSPFNSGPQSPFSSGSSPFTAGQQAQIQSAFSAAGLGDWITNLGSDVWGVISKILPKNADGSIDWGGALKDFGSWVKDNKDTILQGLSAYNNYQRSEKSDQYAQQALDLAKQHYDAKQPLRDAGQAGMLNPQANAPDISALRTQGQNGLNISAPAPLPLATPNLGNAQRIANGPQSGNPFTKTLPIAGVNPMPSITPPPMPQTPPMRSIAPPSHPSDAGPMSTPQTLPLASLPNIADVLNGSQASPLPNIAAAINGGPQPGKPMKRPPNTLPLASQ